MLLKLAVDASNIRAGGGVTHLVECISAYDPQQHNMGRVTVFGSEATLARLPQRAWLDKRISASLQGGSVRRLWWRQACLTKEARRVADILLVPGGSYLGAFQPFVAIAQNLLPFDRQEQAREGFSLKRARLEMLAYMQAKTFRRADGVIYLTGISRDQIERSMGFRVPRSMVVHHGTQPRFTRPPKEQKPASAFGPGAPFRLLYVSILEPYKHQDIVIEAVAQLRGAGIFVSLDLIGPGGRSSQSAIRRLIRRRDPHDEFLHYHGMVNYDKLDQYYAEADAFIFASSCETFGIILLEAMAAGLPLLCSHRSALPEVAGTAAEYLDPLNVASVTDVLRRVVGDLALRRSLAFRSSERARQFSWTKCADETFGFVREVYDAFRLSRGEGTCAV